MTDYPHIFSPLTVKGMTLRNRICSTGHMASWMHHNGVPNDSCRAYFEERAKGRHRAGNAGRNRGSRRRSPGLLPES